MRPRVVPTSSLRLIATLITSSIVVLAAGQAHAQWSSSPSTNLQVSTSTSLTGLPSVFPDHAGGAVLAWGDGRGTCVQRLDAFGTKMWGATGTVISTTNQTFTPRAVSDDAGGVIAGWSETAVGHTGFFVQRISRTGVALWTAGGINLTATGAVAGLCSDGAAGVIAVWTQTVGGLVNMYANRVTAAGTVSWGASGKLVYSSGDIKNPDMVVTSTAGGAIIGWHNVLLANISDPDTLFFQRVDGSGNPQWPSPGTPSYVRVITLDDTKIELSCAGNAGAAFYTTQRVDSCYLHLLQPAGTFTSPVVGWAIAGPTTAKVHLGLAKCMVPDGSGGVVFAWRDESYGGSIFGRIRAQRLNASGVRQWPTSGGTFIQVCPGSNDQNFPGVVRDGYGNFLFGWEDYRNGVNINLWAQKVDAATGALQWASGGVVFASATDNQFAPLFAAGNPGNGIAAFNDARTGQPRLFAQFLGPTGALTPVNTVPFTTVTPSPSARGTSGYATDGTRMYLEGGGGVGGSPISNTLESYNPATDTWTPLGSGYVARWFGNLAYVPETGKLYALNGNDNISIYHTSVEEIPTGGGAATLRAANPQPREAAGVTVWNGRIYVVGGNLDPTGLLNDVRTFDPVANTWSLPLAPLPVARVGLTATAYNGSIFAVGGQDAAGKSKRVDRYDIASNTWAPIPLADAPLPITFHASAVTGGLIWYAGDNTTGWTLMSYAPATDTWTMHTTNMLSRRYGQAGGVGNKLIIAGGTLGTPSQNIFDTQVSDVSVLVAATPLAAVTLPVGALKVSSLGPLVFAAPGESTLVTLNFASVAGPGTATVERYPGPPANVSFSAGSPTAVGTTRWVMSQSGLAPFSATVFIQLYGLPDAIGPGSGISIYQRPTPGSGPFTLLPTAYDPVSHRVSATVTSFSEFILASGGIVGVPVETGPVVALAIRPLGANPTRGAPSFQLSLPLASPARLELFDLQGRVVASRTLSLPAGRHTLQLTGARAIASGLYFARLTQGDRIATARVVITP